MKKKLIIIFVTAFVFFSYSQNNVNESEYERQLAKDKELAEKARQMSRDKNLEKSAFGTDQTFGTSPGINYSDYNGKDYSEVAIANNWSSENAPANMEEQYQEYYRNKKIKTTLIISSLILLSIFLFYHFDKVDKRQKENKFRESVGEKFSDYEKLEIDFHNKINELKNLLKSQIISEKEYKEKEKQLQLLYDASKSKLDTELQNEKNDKVKNDKIKQIEIAYKNGILSEKEYNEKIKNLN